MPAPAVSRPMSRTAVRLALLLLLALAAFAADLLWGNVHIEAAEIGKALLGRQDDLILREIILGYRLPKAAAAFLCGGALALAGLLMQTLFRNPLAGPDVLGVSAGATLGVALLTMGGTALLPLLTGSAADLFRMCLLSGWGQSLAAIVGAVFVMLLVGFAALRVPQVTTLLIIGLMASYFIGAAVSVLQSISSPDTLKLFTSWTFGSLSSVGGRQLRILAPLVLVGALPVFFLAKALNLLQLGERRASALGVRVRRTHYAVILCASLLTGAVTAFAGPVAFLGVTMPHIARGLFLTPDHRTLLPASFLCGSITLQLCDLLAQLPPQPLPLNAVTALFGAPILVYILLKKP